MIPSLLGFSLQNLHVCGQIVPAHAWFEDNPHPLRLCKIYAAAETFTSTLAVMTEVCATIAMKPEITRVDLQMMR